MSQLSLFDRCEDATRLRKTLLRAARSVVQAAGPKVVAPELDISPSQLLDSIEERERHSLSLRQICTILTYDDTGAILSALCAATGHEPPVRQPQLDDSARLERLLRSIAKAGPVGRALLEDAFGAGAGK